MAHSVQSCDDIYPLFALSSTETSPFPSNRFTVSDPAQNTARRVNLPVPGDCTANASDCADVSFLNRLDGFSMAPRITIPFSGDIDISTVTSDAVFLVKIRDEFLASCPLSNPLNPPTEPRIGITEAVWDPATETLVVRPDQALEEHARYAVVVTRDVRDTCGYRIEPSDDFQHRDRLLTSSDPVLSYYGQQLQDAECAAEGAGTRSSELAVLSVFSTQSATYLVQKINQQIRASGAPAAPNFNTVVDGSRAVFPASSVQSITFNRQTSVTGALSSARVDLSGFNLAPGAVGTIAFGRFAAPDYMVHPGEYIPEIATRSGTVAVQGTNSLDFVVTLPAGTMPAGGWPVAVWGHGTDREKFQSLNIAAMLASRGIAVIAFSMVGHGFGPNSTATISRTDGTTATVLSAGRGIDQDGNGTIGSHDGDSALAPRLLQVNADAQVQNIADLMQLTQVLRAGVDVDGDGVVDLDPNRIYYSGHSLGGMYGIGFFALTSEVRAAAFLAPAGPLLENRRLSPTARSSLGQLLAARTPSLVNSDYGLTSIGGVAVQAPYFNENMPLQGQAAVTNTVPGAMAIQQYVDRATWIAQRGNPVAFAPLLRRAPPTGVAPRPFYLAFARGDTASPNPNTTAIVRAGAIADRAAFYRHDLFFAANPTAPKNPHGFPLQLNVASFVPVVQGAQGQVADFLSSDGANLTVPSPSDYWEVPIRSALPDDLGFIP